MAVVVTPLDSTLVVSYQDGITPAGGPISRLKSLSYVRSDASEQALHDVAQALFSLSLHPVLDVLLRKELTNGYHNEQISKVKLYNRRRQNVFNDDSRSEGRSESS